MDIVEKLKKHIANKYEFIGLIGKGGFAEVHLAKDIILERKVAVKILLSQHSNDPEIVERFLREAKLYARLEHENLIPIFDTGIIDDYAYIIMKYIKGQSLKALQEKHGKLPADLLARVIKKMAAAMDYIHAKGIIHRDIKPANVLIEEETQNIYLADFGIARADMGKTLTQSGLIIGTPSYISPEQIKGKKIDHRADLYAFGAMLYELASGKPIFTGDSSLEILYQHVNEEPEPIAQKAAHLPREIKYIISKCIEKNPEHRFQSAAEILEVLEKKRATVMSRYLRSLETKRAHPTIKRMLMILLFLIFTSVALFVVNNLLIDKRDQKSIQMDQKAVSQTQSTDIGKEPERQEPVGEPESAGKGDSPAEKRIEQEKTKGIETTRQKQEMPSEPIRVRFSSYPLGAEVYWQNEKLGDTSQAFFRTFPPGKYSFKFVIPGYQTLEKELSVSKENNIVHQKFLPYGFVTITSSPFANIRIDGQEAGTTPLYRKILTVGPHRIELHKPGYETIVDTVEIKEKRLEIKSFIIKKGE